MQMSVSCLLVLGEKAKGLVDGKTMEHWFSSYIGTYSNTIYLPLVLMEIMNHGLVVVLVWYTCYCKVTNLL